MCCHLLIFCQLLLLSLYPIAAEFGLTPEGQLVLCVCVCVCVCVYMRGQRDKSGAYLLLISAGHHLHFTLTLFIMVAQTHTGSADPSSLLMVALMAPV